MIAAWTALLALTGWRARGAAAVLGVLAATGHAPFGFWWLALPALALLTALVAAAPGPREGALRAFCGGTGHFALALSWIVEPFLVEPDRFGWMAPFALIFMATGLALFWAGIAARAYLLVEDSGPDAAKETFVQ